MTTTREMFAEVEAALGSALTASERRRLKTTDDWADLEAGRPAAARDCADVIGMWRAEHVEAPAAERALMDDTEALRVEALAWARYTEASARGDVAAFRAEHLGGVLLDLGDVAGWARSHPGAVHRGGALLAFPDGGSVGRVRTKPGSALAELAGLAELLAGAYWWHVETATAFVLADVVPIPQWVVVRTVESSQRARERIVLDVDPDTPPEAVARAYTAARTEMGERRRHRRPSPDSLRLTRLWFVLGRPQYAHLARRWNRDHPEGPHHDHRSARRTVVRCVESLTGEPFSR